MELRDDSGLSVAVASAGEALALSRDRRALPPGVNVLRVPDPPAGSWVDLARAGFVRKPSWITWLSPVCDTDEEWLGFTPVAAEPFGMNPWRDEADLLLSLDGLNDLVLMLGYLGDVSAGDGFPGYRLEARSRRPVDPGRCDFPFVLGARHRLLPD